MKRRDFLALAPASAVLRLGWPLQSRDNKATSAAPVIIEAAINGGTARAQNPNVPRLPAEIADDALRCLEAGAAIVHSHTDDPVMGGKTGRHDPAPYLEAWRPILAKRRDALLYGTMAGGGGHTTIEERASHVLALARAGVARFAVVDTGTTNFGPAAAPRGDDSGRQSGACVAVAGARRFPRGARRARLARVPRPRHGFSRDASRPSVNWIQFAT